MSVPLSSDVLTATKLDAGATGVWDRLGGRAEIFMLGQMEWACVITYIVDLEVLRC